MLINTIIGVFLFLALLALHECGHIISARILGLSVSKIGLAKSPVIHPYIEVKDVPDNYVKFIFLYSGPFVTLTLFFVSIYKEWLSYSPLYYAFVTLISVEYNPYHSDFTISGIFNKEMVNRYVKNNLWYIWFLIWTTLIIFCFAPSGLKKFVTFLK